MRLRVLLRNAFSPFTGYGNDGIGIAQALLRMGVDLSIDPSLVTPPIPPEVAALLTRPLDPPYDVFIHCADPSLLGLSDEMRAVAHRRVAWTMWEWDGPFEAAPGSRAGWEARMRNYDLVASYERHADALFDFLPPERRVIVQGGFDGGFYAAPDPLGAVRDWSAPFTFLTAGALGPRKNPVGGVAAFRRFREQFPQIEARYVLKGPAGVLPPQIAEWAPGVELVTGRLSREEMRRLYLSAHVYVAPSRGEGKNLPAMEAAATGAALILTDVPGHRGWAMDGFTRWVRGEYAPDAANPGARSFAMDVDDMAAAMGELAGDRARSRRMGAEAGRTVPQNSWERSLERLLSAVLRAPIS